MAGRYTVEKLEKGGYRLTEIVRGQRIEQTFASPDELTAYLKSIGIADKEIQAIYQQAGIIKGH